MQPISCFVHIKLLQCGFFFYYLHRWTRYHAEVIDCVVMKADTILFFFLHILSGFQILKCGAVHICPSSLRQPNPIEFYEISANCFDENNNNHNDDDDDGSRNGSLCLLSRCGTCAHAAQRSHLMLEIRNAINETHLICIN